MQVMTQSFPDFRYFIFLKFSLLPGNIYVYLSLKTEIIHHAMRYSLFSILSVVSAVGLILFILIIFRSYLDQRRNGLIKPEKDKTSTLADISQTLKTAGRLLKTRNMRLLLIIFVFLGKYSDRYSSGFSRHLFQVYHQYL
jgi:hypothetical protein